MIVSSLTQTLYMSKTSMTYINTHGYSVNCESSFSAIVFTLVCQNGANFKS